MVDLVFLYLKHGSAINNIPIHKVCLPNIFPKSKVLEEDFEERGRGRGRREREGEGKGEGEERR